jgi:2,3-bisphosphoglycerate-independent phosphoglycerate mutase
MAGRRKKKSSRHTSRGSKKRKAPRRRKIRKLRKKVVFLVIDGLADTPYVGKTPLSDANKPNMDWLAEHGVVGELKLLPKKAWTPMASTSISHKLNIALLGYNPKRYPMQRGPLEAVGVNIPFKEGYLALRCNFATVDKSYKVIDRRGGRETYGLNEIARYINRHVKLPVGFVFIRTYGHRAVLIIKKQLSDRISTNDPQMAGEYAKRIEPLDDSKLAKESAEIVQEFIDSSHNIIEYHPKNSERIDRGMLPANYILAREAGNRIIALPNFSKKWRFNQAVCISENGVMKATCMLAGFNSITVPEDDPQKTLDFIFENIDSSLAGYDFIYAHIKPADEAAHDGDFERKKAVIEAIDKKLEDFRDFKGVLVVTCDHITSCETKKHMPGPVPVLVYGRRKDKVKTFDEFSAKKGLLKKLTGRQLLKYVFGR